MVRTDVSTAVVLIWGTHLSAHRSGDAVVLADGHGRPYELTPTSRVHLGGVYRNEGASCAGSSAAEGFVVQSLK